MFNSVAIQKQNRIFCISVNKLRGSLLNVRFEKDEYRRFE